jgi:predicted dehydrogenase
LLHNSLERHIIILSLKSGLREGEMSRNLRRIRVGLIAYGYAGKTFHAPLVRAVPGLALTTEGSSRPEVVRKHLGEVAVCSPMEVAIHPDVDLVVIASPNHGVENG